MATVDTQASLLTYLFSLLTADDTLKAAMGGTVRLYHTWAEPDAEFPYLVHRIDVVAAEPFVMRQATYYLDIWSDSPNADAILAIRKRIIELLDELEPSTTDIAGGRLWLQTDAFIPETEQGIWHYATMWNLRYYRKTEVAGILSR